MTGVEWMQECRSGGGGGGVNGGGYLRPDLHCQETP